MANLLPEKVEKIVRENADKYALSRSRVFLDLLPAPGFKPQVCVIGLLCLVLLPKELLKRAIANGETEYCLSRLAEAGYHLDYMITGPTPSLKREGDWEFDYWLWAMSDSLHDGTFSQLADRIHQVRVK